MDDDKPINSLKWSNTSFSLNEFVDRFGVPQLVYLKEGLCDVNEACSFQIDELLMLHTIRTEHKLMAENSVGRSVALPLDCESKLLVCPLLMYCRYDRILLSQIPLVYPNIKYFRVLENHWDKLAFVEPDSILEVKMINTKGSFVKFQDIDLAVPFNSRVVFEPLLDYREYMLKDAVKYFGLPAKVRFLPAPTAKEEHHSELENSVSNLGKVVVLHSAEPQEFIVATKINLNSTKTSVKCLQIPKNYSLNVWVAESCLENHPEYINIVRNLNRAFLDAYDVNDLDNLDKYEYIDSPDETRKGIIHSVLEPTVDKRDSEAPELPQRNGSGSIASVEQYENCIVKPGQAVRKLQNQDSHVYESIDESDHEYEDVCGSTLDYVNMTSEEDEYLPMGWQDEYLCSPDWLYLPVLPNSNGGENSGEVTAAKSGSQNSLKDPIPSDLSSLTVAGVTNLLKCLNMERYIRKFQEEQVDGDILVDLDEMMLQCLGLMPFHVRKLIKVINGWRPNVDSTEKTVTP